ncbi:MAG: hypothetical protein K6A72_08555 [Lachnospiraceae bacterium]|nr:hypothetical protein [Lachnospiraceae bacterium]
MNKKNPEKLIKTIVNMLTGIILSGALFAGFRMSDVNAAGTTVDVVIGDENDYTHTTPTTNRGTLEITTPDYVLNNTPDRTYICLFPSPAFGLPEDRFVLVITMDTNKPAGYQNGDSIDVKYSFDYKGETFSGSFTASGQAFDDTVQFTMTNPLVLSLDDADDDDEESGPPSHHHDFVWHTSIEATNDHLGEEELRCKICNLLIETRSFDNADNLHNALKQATADAPQGGTVTLERGEYISINKTDAENLSKRPDLTTVVHFTYNHQKYEMTVPAGFDWVSSLNEDGWAGFMYIAGFPEVTLNVVE